MSPHKMIPMLRINSCSDPHKWYANLVGLLVPDLGFDPTSGWKSKERAGYTNYILGKDAVRTRALVPEHLLGRWPYITHETLAKPAATPQPKTCAASCNAMGICQALEGCEHEERINAELGRKGVKPVAPKPPPAGDVTGRCEKLDGEAYAIWKSFSSPAAWVTHPAPTGQSRTHSMAETMANIVVGFAASMVIQALVLPAMGHHITLAQNFWITCIFTVASVVRGYGIRRIFNRFQTKVTP